MSENPLKILMPEKKISKPKLGHKEEMSSIFSHFMGVYRLNLRIPKAKFHYIHGIPGVPAEGKVVLLKNSKNGSQIYLVGSTHDSIGCANIVKKVINHVRPDSVAIELCMRRARYCLESVSEDDDFYTMYLKSRIVPGGLSMKVGIIIRNCWHLLQGDVRSSSRMDMEVAMEESSRVGAECVFIDQDMDVLQKEVTKIGRSCRKAYHECDKLLKRRNNTRAFWQEYGSALKEANAEEYKVYVQDRDKHMFARLREMEGKLIVAVVGMGHMDGIELLWKCAEEDDDVQPLGATSEVADQQKQ